MVNRIADSIKTQMREGFVKPVLWAGLYSSGDEIPEETKGYNRIPVALNNKVFKRTGNSWDEGSDIPIPFVRNVAFAIDSDGKQYIIDEHLRKIYRKLFDEWKELGDIPAPIDPMIKIPAGIGITSNNEFVVIEDQEDTYKIEKTNEKSMYISKTTLVSWNGDYIDTPIENVRDMAYDSDENIYVIDQGTQKIYKNTDGTWDSGLDYPARNIRGITISDNGDIQAVTRTGTHYTYASGSWTNKEMWTNENVMNPITDITSMCRDEDDFLYALDGRNRQIWSDRFHLVNDVVTPITNQEVEFVDRVWSRVQDLVDRALADIEDPVGMEIYKGSVYIVDNLTRDIYRDSKEFLITKPPGISYDPRAVAIYEDPETKLATMAMQERGQGRVYYYDLAPLIWPKTAKLPKPPGQELQHMDDPKDGEKQFYMFKDVTTLSDNSIILLESNTKKYFTYSDKPVSRAASPSWSSVLSNPQGITIDTNNNVYVLEGNKIYRNREEFADISSIVTTPVDVSIDSGGLNVYVMDTGARKIFTIPVSNLTGNIDLDPKYITSIDIESRITDPTSMVFTGDIYVTDNGTKKVYLWNGTEWAAAGVDLHEDNQNPQGIMVNNDGHIVVLDATTLKIYIYDGIKWEPSNIPAGITPQGIALLNPTNTDKLFYNVVLDTTTNNYFSFTTAQEWDSGTDLPPSSTNPVGIAADHEDNVIVVDATTKRFYTRRNNRWNGGANLPAAITNPVSIDIDDDGNLYILQVYPEKDAWKITNTLITNDISFEFGPAGEDWPDVNGGILVDSYKDGKVCAEFDYEGRSLVRNSKVIVNKGAIEIEGSI